MKNFKARLLSLRGHGSRAEDNTSSTSGSETGSVGPSATADRNSWAITERLGRPPMQPKPPRPLRPLRPDERESFYRTRTTVPSVPAIPPHGASLPSASGADDHYFSASPQNSAWSGNSSSQANAASGTARSDLCNAVSQPAEKSSGALPVRPKGQPFKPMNELTPNERRLRQYQLGVGAIIKTLLDNPKALENYSFRELGSIDAADPLGDEAETDQRVNPSVQESF